jgi:hypothetical protein
LINGNAIAKFAIGFSYTVMEKPENIEWIYKISHRGKVKVESSRTLMDHIVLTYQIDAHIEIMTETLGSNGEVMSDHFLFVCLTLSKKCYFFFVFDKYIVY